MNTNRPLQMYRVRVGHWETCVKARDSDEAVLVARMQLSRELPRLYDVIRRLEAERFQIEKAA